MTDDFETQLRARLARIAAAAPVEPDGVLTRVAAAPVRGGVAARRLAFRGLVPILVVVVVGTLLTALVKVGPFAPGATAAIAPATAEPNPPANATVSDGPFELTLRSRKSRYASGEPIQIEASFTYSGDEPVQIVHSREGSPLDFGIVEPVLGDLILGPGGYLPCIGTVLEPGYRDSQDFRKSGGWTSEDPRAAEYEAFFHDPLLRLSQGTWHVYAVADFSIGECGGEKADLRVEVAIEVTEDSFESPAPIDNGPVEDIATDGLFELVFWATKSRYAPNEQIEASASLTYRGPQGSIEIGHDSAGPIVFGIREKVYGEISVGSISILMCDRSTFLADEPLIEPFRKGGGFSGDHPDAEQFKAWVMDPELRLPEGTWHLYAQAAGDTGCGAKGAPTFNLEAEITIVVGADPAATPSDVTQAPDRNEPVYGGDDIGDFTLQLKAGRSTYASGEPIDVSAAYTFGSGVGNTITVSHFHPEVAFSIIQISPDAMRIPRPIYDSACQEVTLEDGVPRVVSPTDANLISLVAASWPSSTAEALEQSVLQLPVGRWRIIANVSTAIGTCDDRGDLRELSAAIEIDVVGPEEADIELATGAVPTGPDGGWICATARGAGVLAINPRTGLGLVDRSGEMVTDVIWPDGYTARFENGQPILLDQSDHIVARGGEFITLGGGHSPDNVFHVCGAGLQD